MNDKIKVFFCEETLFVEVFLRRFTFSSKSESGCQHDATNPMPIGRFEWPLRTYLDGDVKDCSRDHPGWPPTCTTCGYAFQPADEWQATMCRVFKRTDTGEELPVKRYASDLPIGAVVEMWWDARKGFDGRGLMVITPGGAWNPDRRASNCTRPDDKTHRCWVRHGRPEDGTMHVDKNGDTCAAGAGSIIAGDYHGFLHGGHLVCC